jgi:hypothetical protein
LEQPLEQFSLDARRLIREHPPVWNGRNKQRIFSIASSSGAPFLGQVVYARWPTRPLPQSLERRSAFSIRRGDFAYEALSRETEVAWHVNFAGPNLFAAYSSSLFAQDEIQVSEHPVLGSLREALDAAGKNPRTVDSQGNPTPVTISGVQRRCSIDVTPNPAGGWPDSLYGNAFARASEERVAAATRPVSPPTISNILAMAAPAYGRGEYTREEIHYVVAAAYTGFAAARQESMRIAPHASLTTIQTGFWGCGAFGGNRSLMTILQSLAADLAGVGIVFWTHDDLGVEQADRARREYDGIRMEMSTTSRILDHLFRQGFQWGESDGN